LSCLKRYYHIRPAQFIYPDEAKVAGSTQLFTALLTQCKKRGVTPICRFIPRQNTAPQFVALIPQEEELNESGVQTTPPGFHVIFLPYADDLRKLNLDPAPKADEQQIEKGKEIIRKLQFKFDSENFGNPVIQTHWRNIEALALNKDAPEEIEDFTMPKFDLMEKRAGHLLQEFKDMVFPDGYDPEAKGKRRSAPSAESGASKRAKKEDVKVEIDIKKEAENKKLEKLTVDILKSFCTKVGIKTTGKKKADLVNAVYEHFES
jgi:ATP-dependent DNA helicase 2 subunit 1